jgi:ABC-type sugar transport system substrate-binding protein
LKTLLRLAAAAVSAGSLAIGVSPASAQAPPQQQQGPDLHTILHIRPDQEAAWRAYQEGVKPPAGIIATLRSSAQRAQSMTTPQRLDLQEQNRALEDTIFQHQVAAVRKFYPVLSPEQQRTFDQIFAPHPNGQGLQR